MIELDVEFFRGVLEALPLGLYIVNRDGKILFWNEGAEQITGYLTQDVMGRAWSKELLVQRDGEGEDLEGQFPPLLTALRDGKSVTRDVSLRHKEGHRVQVRLQAFPIRDRSGAVIGAAESFEESPYGVEWDRRQSKLEAYGCLDQESRVLNFGIMQAHLREALGVFSEHPVPFSLLCLEIDQLEHIRTRGGVAAVRSALRVVGHSLEGALRPTDFVGRWQGNEFLAIVTECSLAEITRVADRLRRTVSSSEVRWWGDSLPLTVSVGASSVKQGDTQELLVARAQAALRGSVAQGGDRVTLSTE